MRPNSDLPLEFRILLYNEYSAVGKPIMHDSAKFHTRSIGNIQIYLESRSLAPNKKKKNTRFSERSAETFHLWIPKLNVRTSLSLQHFGLALFLFVIQFSRALPIKQEREKT